MPCEWGCTVRSDEEGMLAQRERTDWEAVQSGCWCKMHSECWFQMIRMVKTKDSMSLTCHNWEVDAWGQGLAPACPASACPDSSSAAYKDAQQWLIVIFPNRLTCLLCGMVFYMILVKCWGCVVQDKFALLCRATALEPYRRSWETKSQLTNHHKYMTHAPQFLSTRHCAQPHHTQLQDAIHSTKGQQQRLMTNIVFDGLHGVWWHAWCWLTYMVFDDMHRVWWHTWLLMTRIVFDDIHGV